ncbi:MAG: UDP-glucose 4-epimerase GalE [Myxococcales bacterium]|nr:UDP-glucose 4-epimerase GalE [Myxococcales bacterium]
MRVLVTGGAGYIGSVVVEELLASGHDVVVYDNLQKGHADAVVAPARLVRGDVLDTESLVAVLRGERIEAVIHMAADSIVGQSVQEPARYYRTNVDGGLSLLDAMRAAGVRDLVFSSTAAVYGEPAKQPIEEGDPTAPTNPYGETKLVIEHALDWFEGAYGTRSVRLRYFNAAGASERNGERHAPETHLIPIVLDVAAGRRPDVTIFGDDYDTPDGTCVRDYIHVLDLARAHVLAVEALGRGAPSATFNLGCGGRGYTVREVIRTVEAVTGRDVAVRVGARRPGDSALLVASSRRIVDALGWRPTRQDLGVIVESAWRWMLAHDLGPQATATAGDAPR